MKGVAARAASEVSAVIHDGAPPGGGWVAPLGWAAAMMAALYIGYDASTGAVIGIMLALAGIAEGSTLLRRRAEPRRAALTFAPGRLTIHDGGRVEQIDARSLVGAVVAQTSDGGILALAQDERVGYPIVVELSRADHVEEAKRAIGVGRNPIGEVTWNLGPRAIDGLDRVVRAVGATAWLVSAIVIPMAPPAPMDDVGLGALIVGAGSVALLFLFTLAQPLLPFRSLTLRRDHLVIRSGAPITLPYRSVKRLTARRDAVVVHAHDRPEIAIAVSLPKLTGVGLTPKGRTHFTICVRAAAAAEVTRDPERVAGIDFLARGSESARTWLARIDTQASAHAYRSAAAIDDDALFRVLEAPDADGHTRAAAARILASRAPEQLRTRIGAVIAAVHDPADRARIRVASDTARDIDGVVGELEEADDADALREG